MEILELKALIKESMREVLREERLPLCKILIPYVRDEEQAKIEAEFASPSNHNDDDIVDMKDWVKHGLMQNFLA